MSRYYYDWLKHRDLLLCYNEKLHVSMRAYEWDLSRSYRDKIRTIEIIVNLRTRTTRQYQGNFLS